jgi:hypothetical protein
MDMLVLGDHVVSREATGDAAARAPALTDAAGGPAG